MTRFDRGSAPVNVLNVTSPPAFLPPEDILRRMSYAMNRGDFVFGMGAFLTPILVAMLMRKLRFEQTFLFLSSFAVVPRSDGSSSFLHPGIGWTAIPNLIGGYARRTDAWASSTHPTCV